MTELYHLKYLPENKIEAACKVAARAMQDDPIFVKFYPDPIERAHKNFIRCKNMILVGILSGEVYITSNNIEGISVWNPHEIKDWTIGKQSKEILRESRKVRREIYSDREYAIRTSTSMQIFNSLKDEYANFPHWYLTFIGVDPVHQGKGYASMLLRAKLSELDKQRLPCYLNTQNEEILPIYEHFGFKLVGKKQVPNTDIYYYGMLRNKKK